jgi:hypothetical protein
VNGAEELAGPPGTIDLAAPIMLGQFEDALAFAAATACDPRIIRQLECLRDTVRRFDDTALAAAAAAAPPGRMDSMLAGILRTPVMIERARPELVTETALTRILDALQLIDRDLNDHLATGDPAVLDRALGSGLENFHQVLRRCFGYWQLGEPAHPRKIKRLDLRLEMPDGADRPDTCPVLRLLAGGVDGLAVVRGRRYTGFPPAALLGPDAPLLPAKPARHVPLYTGADAAGTIAALIHVWGDGYIAWSDFRQFEETYAPGMRPDPLDGSPFGMPHVFDAGQYRAEVQRASMEWPA